MGEELDRDRYRGALLGLAVGDALGTTVEFREPGSFGPVREIEALEAALWAVASHDGYEEAVLAAVNLGDDADTTAAIAGQLAGAIDGAEAIPPRWREQVFEGEEIVRIADDLCGLATAG